MKKIYKPVAVLMLGLSLFSCEKIVEDLNVDPNNPTDAPANLILTGTQLSNVVVQEGIASLLVSIWSGYATGHDRQWRDYANYNITSGNFDSEWNNVFRGTVNNARITIDKAMMLNNRKMAGIAKIVMANSLATATQLWGDIPLEQAGQIQEYPNPMFESQADVYTKLLALLDEAIADLETGIGTVGAEDIHFGGDATKWIQTAYTLKARLLTDTEQYAAAYTAAENGISTYANSLYAPHGQIANINQNQFYAFLTQTRPGDISAASAYNVNLLDPASSTYRGNAKTDESARFLFYYRPVGVNTSGVAEPNTSSTATARGFFAMDARFPMVTYQENILTLAETALRSGMGVEQALEYLNSYRNFLSAGGYVDPTYQTTAASKYEPYEAADFAAGGIENQDGISQEDALLREIIQERYVTFYGTHLGWNDERRTRGEVYEVGLSPNAGTELPWRFIYPQNELNSNSNAPTVVPGIFSKLPIYE
ncbi:SusD/RagB family nutrient-binding outer membrane lipoprotein [Pontibacter diazotrophicus]|uniref:SusD/RagB family nutrient-binding outer membrane lipoprotein n=1 Tax=Pontibacter diazotrophicus TaxID=1400979 RepID=A0A3D8L7X1_9BACT|nr:SusD/RagB family nutrient-binding outer membrane lipoprotein [Pontibacter diazotrophicus]RDV13474.1 SusD/RagB family nutrient-binding outer membrane lipoprotein [Pontibacter diazotrophicus]